MFQTVSKIIDENGYFTLYNITINVEVFKPASRQFVRCFYLFFIIFHWYATSPGESRIIYLLGDPFFFLFLWVGIKGAAQRCRQIDAMVLNRISFRTKFRAPGLRAKTKCVSSWAKLIICPVSGGEAGCPWWIAPF